jgi:hypothetical protein
MPEALAACSHTELFKDPFVEMSATTPLSSADIAMEAAA